MSPDFMLCCLRTIRLLLTNQIACESLSRIRVSDTVIRKDMLDNALYQIMSGRFNPHLYIRFNSPWCSGFSTYTNQY